MVSITQDAPHMRIYEADRSVLALLWQLSPETLEKVFSYSREREAEGTMQPDAVSGAIERAVAEDPRVLQKITHYALGVFDGLSLSSRLAVSAAAYEQRMHSQSFERGETMPRPFTIDYLPPDRKSVTGFGVQEIFEKPPVPQHLFLRNQLVFLRTIKMMHWMQRASGASLHPQ